jgi:hypothetical protein
MNTHGTRSGGKIISFGSPKGGAGRTMVMANLAALYSLGCPRVGLTKSTVLAVDLDFQAPGLHFYDFAAYFKSPTSRITVAEQSASSWADMRDQLKVRPIGVLPWLDEILRDRRLDYRGSVPPAAAEVAKTVREIIRESARESLVNPNMHVIRIFGEPGTPPFLILPATDPLQPGYDDLLSRFDSADFFKRQLGFAILDVMYAHVLIATEGARDFPRRVLLDQGGGTTMTGMTNRAYADHHVMVSALNQQHRAGLMSFMSSVKSEEVPNTSIVFSQYGARPLAIGSAVNRTAFVQEDAIRADIKDRYVKHGPFGDGQFFVVDFAQDAVGKEHLFPTSTHSYDELARLVISIERSSVTPAVADVPWDTHELRVLGEFVGMPGEEASGALGGLTAWLGAQLRGRGKLKSYATEHENIAKLFQATALGPGVLPDPDSGSISRLEESQMQGVRLTDFDIIAAPVSSVTVETLELLEELAGFEASDDAYSEDCWGPLTEKYARETIYGWEKYARFPDASGRRRLVGYPFFVEHQLLVVNRRNLGPQFVNLYRRKTMRKFRGFVDPIDLKVAAEIGGESLSELDGLLMTLSGESVARWYEWRTLVAMFADHTGTYPTEGQSLAEGTARYLELCRDSDPRSRNTTWNTMHELFYAKNAVGMALIWPDAIPRGARSGDRPFEYIRPPGHFGFEECWLLVVPRGRGNDRPSKEAIEKLLRRFMTDSAQQIYLEEGGLPVHRRVLRDVDNWRTFAFLAPLSRWPGEEAVESPEQMTRVGLSQKEREVHLLAVLDEERRLANQPLTSQRILEVLAPVSAPEESVNG